MVWWCTNRRSRLESCRFRTKSEHTKREPMSTNLCWWTFKWTLSTLRSCQWKCTLPTSESQQLWLVIGAIALYSYTIVRHRLSIIADYCWMMIIDAFITKTTVLVDGLDWRCHAVWQSETIELKWNDMSSEMPEVHQLDRHHTDTDCKCSTSICFALLPSTIITSQVFTFSICTFQFPGSLFPFSFHFVANLVMARFLEVTWKEETFFLLREQVYLVLEKGDLDWGATRKRVTVKGLTICSLVCQNETCELMQKRLLCKRERERSVHLLSKWTLRICRAHGSSLIFWWRTWTSLDWGLLCRGHSVEGTLFSYHRQSKIYSSPQVDLGGMLV